jgi:menaquinone-dependent protoporphyrinogen oxidase
MDVLIAYASKHSSTAEIAERIGAVMREAGCTVEVRPASAVRDLSGYDAVVLGSAVYAKRWRPAARSFARRHARTLKALPVWLFSSGPLGAPEEHPTAPMPPFAERLALQVGAREHVMFGGRVPLDPSNFIERAMLTNTPPEKADARDWPAIEAWARGVAEQVLGEAQGPSGRRTAAVAERR